MLLDLLMNVTPMVFRGSTCMYLYVIRANCCRHSTLLQFISSSFDTIFQEASEPKFKELLGKARKHNDIHSQEIKDDIINEEHSLIEWKTTLDILMKEDYKTTGKCHFALGMDEFFMERVALAFPINNPWIEQINKRYISFSNEKGHRY